MVCILTTDKVYFIYDTNRKEGVYEVCLDGSERLPLDDHRVGLVLVRRHQRPEPGPQPKYRYAKFRFSKE